MMCSIYVNGLGPVSALSTYHFGQVVQAVELETNLGKPGSKLRKDLEAAWRAYYTEQPARTIERGNVRIHVRPDDETAVESALPSV